MTSAEPPSAQTPTTGASATAGPGLPRAVLVLLGAAGLVVAVAGMRAVAGLLAPTFLAVTLVITVVPLQQWLLARRVPRWVAVSVSVVLLYALLLALVAALLLSVTQLVGLLPQYAAQFQTLYDAGVDWLAAVSGVDRPVRTALGAVNPGSLVAIVQTSLQVLLDGLTRALAVLTLLVVVLLFLTVDALDVPRRARVAAASHPAVVGSLTHFAHGVRRYWLVTTVFGLVVAALDTLALYWLGIPLALTWGLLSFITNYIPNVGFVLGVLPPALLALLEGGPGLAVTVVAVYTVLNVVIQTIIQPRFTGDAVGLTSTVAFLSLVFWGFVLGPLGALLAIPMTSFVKAVLVDADPRGRWVDALVSTGPADPTAASVRAGSARPRRS